MLYTSHFRIGLYTVYKGYYNFGTLKWLVLGAKLGNNL